MIRDVTRHTFRQSTKLLERAFTLIDAPKRSHGSRLQFSVAQLLVVAVVIACTLLAVYQHNQIRALEAAAKGNEEQLEAFARHHEQLLDELIAIRPRSGMPDSWWLSGFEVSYSLRDGSEHKDLLPGEFTVDVSGHATSMDPTTRTMFTSELVTVNGKSLWIDNRDIESVTLTSNYRR